MRRQIWRSAAAASHLAKKSPSRKGFGLKSTPEEEGGGDKGHCGALFRLQCMNFHYSQAIVRRKVIIPIFHHYALMEIFLHSMKSIIFF